MKKAFPYLLTLVLLLFYSCNEKAGQNRFEPSDDLILNDCHVHIMSPTLIEDWKDLGIPFSRPDYTYWDIDTILKKNGAEKINLIGMAYVYGNPDFYQGNEEYSRVMQENDFLFESANKYKDIIKPFFAIDPLKDYAIDEIRRCLEINPNVGLKLHFNSSQVYLTEPAHLEKIKLVFQVAAEHSLPILLHFDNSHPKFGKPDIELLIDEVLADVQPIELTIAHFGTSGGFNQKTRDFLDTFISLFEEGRISKAHNIKFDISAVALDKDSEGVKKLTDEEFKELKKYCDRLGYDKIIFGTDYPLYSAVEYKDLLRNRLNLSKTELKEINQ